MIAAIQSFLGNSGKSYANISEFPPFNNAYARGNVAHNDGVPRSNCPYQYGSFKNFWLNGWDDATFGVRVD